MTHHFKKRLFIIPAIVLLLSGCIGDDDDSNTTNNDSNDVTACLTGSASSPDNVTLTPIEYTEVDETVSANDSAATAQAIQTNSIISGSASYQFPGAGCVDCDDFYVLTVAEGDKFDISLESADSNTKNFDLYLYNGQPIGGATSVGSAEDGDSEERLSYTVEAGVTELIVYIYAVNGTGAYTLTVTTPQEPVAIEEAPAAACLANLQGSVSDAANGSKLGDVTIDLRAGSDTETGDVVATTVTALNGSYSFTDVEAGHYTAAISKDGYFTDYVNVSLEGDQTTEKAFSITEALAAGQLRIVLSWSATPGDLDSYLSGPQLPSGTFEVSFRTKSAGGSTLDTDASYGYGPETVTIETQNSGTYTYWVKDFTNRGNTGSTALSRSGARVSVYNSEGLAKVYYVPTSGSGTRWNVFTLNGETITDVNTLAP